MTASLEPLRIPGPSGPLAVTRRGIGRAESSIVLLHPINTSSVVWHPVMRLLDLPTVALDLRGHGRSGLQGPFTIEDGYLLDVLAVLDELGLGTVHLVGGSLGGAIALAVAALHPQRVHSVTTLGSTLGTGASDAVIDEMVETLAAAGSRRYFADLVPQIVGPQYRTVLGLDETARAAGARPERVVEDILRSAFRADVRGLTGRIQAPVLAIGGTVDPTCPPEMTVEIGARTGGSHVLLEGVGHLPMLERPERVVELIGAHVNSQRPQHR